MGQSQGRNGGLDHGGVGRQPRLRAAGDAPLSQRQRRGASSSSTNSSKAQRATNSTNQPGSHSSGHSQRPPHKRSNSNQAMPQRRRCDCPGRCQRGSLAITICCRLRPECQLSEAPACPMRAPRCVV
ncbi:hypothetical protein SynRCC2555_00371 [Synechococcus sp. WH 8101]|nr:hypothetical protein SynRCC2555_00371 [Synechococcus sp. WH 8101]